MKNVKKGDKIQVEYVGSLDDGTVFDSSEKHDAPLEFVAGEGQLIKGFDEAVIGMAEGEEKDIKITPQEGYGDYNPELVKELPRTYFPQDQEIKPGEMYIMGLQDGRKVQIKILEVNDQNVKIDLNPPLAGKTLNFKIKVLSINN